MTFLVVYCVLLLLVPSQLVVGPLGSAGRPAGLWALGALVWWCCATLGGFNRAHHSPLRLAVGVFALCVVAAYVSGTSSGWWAPLDWREQTSDVVTLGPPSQSEIASQLFISSLRGLLTAGGWVGVVLLTTDGLRGMADVRRLTSWLVGLGSVVASIGILQFFTGLNIASYFDIPGLVASTDFGAVDARSVVNRVSSTAVHPIEFGVVLAALFPLALHYALHVSHRPWRWLPAVTLGFGAMASVSRSAILVLVVAMVVMMVGWPSRYRWRALAVTPLALVAVRAVAPGLIGTLRWLFMNVSNDPSTAGRTDDYHVAMLVFGEHPWFGRGLFTFIPLYYRVLDNQYLGTLLELGAVGLTALVLLFVVGFASARGARLRCALPDERHLALSLSASVAGLALALGTFDALGFPMAAGTTFLVLGLAGGMWQVAAREARTTPVPPPVRVTTGG